jgi:rod shape-determining protein MreD
MVWFLAVPLLAFSALVQSSILRQIPFLDGGLDLPLLIVICWSLLAPDQSLGWAVLAGVFADLFTGGPFGVTPIAFLLAAFTIGQLHGRLQTDSPPVVMAIALFGTVLSHLAAIVLLILTGRTVDTGFALAYITLPTAFLNTLFAIPLYLFLRRLHRATLPPAVAVAEE